MATDYHLGTKETQEVNIFPWIWRETSVADGLGEYTISTLWSQPFHSFFGILALLGLSFEIETKILGALVLLAAFFSIKKLLAYIDVGFWGEIVGTLFYLTNTFFILLFDGGQLSLALAYGILPLIVLYFLQLHELNNIRNSIIFTFWLVVLSFFDIRLLYLVGIIFFLYFFLQIVISYKKIKDLIRIYIPTFIIASIFVISIHSYWLLPAIFVRSPALPVSYERETQIGFLSFSTIGHSIFLQQPHWYKNIFGRISSLNAEFIFIPFLAFLPIFLKRKDLKVGFWLTIALTGIFLSKGSQDPLPEVYPWLFTHVPGFSVFRDPVKFYFLTSLAYSVLFGICVRQIYAFRFKNHVLNRRRQAVPFLIVIYLIWLIRPVFLGEMTGLLSKPPFTNEFAKLNEILKEDSIFSRVFWIPTKAPLGYATAAHPSVEAARLSQKRPFAVGTKGTYETFNFLREAPFMSEIFDVAGIGYIAYPYLDSRRDDMHPDNIKYYYTFSDQLAKRPWLLKVPTSPIPLYKVKEHQDRFFVISNIWWVIGSDSIYDEATKSPNLKLSKNALIFAEEYSGLGARIDELPEAKIVLNKKTDLDLAASFIKPLNLIFPAKNLKIEPDKSRWWKRETPDLIRWRNFLQAKYGIDNQDFDLGGGWAVGEGRLELRIKNYELRKDKILLARVLESTRSGELDFYQDGQVVGRINTKEVGNNIRWFEVGLLPKDGGELKINSSGDINVVNALAVLDQDHWLQYQNKAEEFQNQGRVVSFDEKNIEEISVNVTYQKISPTKYQVLIRNLTKPAMLIFSQSFDPLWKFGKESAFPVYSLLNGFRVERDGEYTIEFEAQKYVYPGLIISGLTALVLIFLLIKSSKSS